MATKKGQRIGIWVIAVALTVGTLAGFLAMIISPQNDAADQARLAQVQAEYQASAKKQSDELSKKYYPIFSKYESLPAKFDAKAVKKVTTKDLKIGEGKEIKKDTEYSAYYIGWKPDAKVFDQSIEGKSLKAPLAVNGVIAGWEEGVQGMKLGGVRQITIPADKAYGENGSKDEQGNEIIPPNTPLTFVVMAIEKPADIPVPQELMDEYERQLQQQPTQ